MTSQPPNWVPHPKARALKARVPHPSQSYREGWDHKPAIHLFILPLAAFIAILPLILQGCSCGHDFNFHLLNWMEAARQFTHGNLHPHWAFSPAYNAGEPRFVFYPPLSWVIGAILGLVMPWAWTPIVYTWLALTAAGLALYRLAREFTSSNAAVVAAAFYLVNPYTLFTAYERTAYAELLAAAWIPLLLLSILRKRVTVPGIAIPVTLLWLTNDPAAVMGCYTLALLTLIRLFQTSTEAVTASRDEAPVSAHLQPAPYQLAATTIAGTLLGLGLAAFYIVPAAYERHYVQIAMALAPGTRFQDNFLFQHIANHPIHNAVLHTASIIAIVLLALTALAIAVSLFIPIPKARVPYPSHPHREGWETKLSILPLAILTIAIAILLTPISSSIWQHIPELAFLQFPWRLLAILATVLALALALILTRLKLKSLPAAALSLVLAAILSYTGIHYFRQYCYPEDTIPASLADFRAHIGTEPNNEYTPIAASNDALGQTNPPYWLLPASKINSIAPANSVPGSAPTTLTLNTTTPQILVLNLRSYPAWHITLNHTVVTTRLHRSDGLVAFPIPSGVSHITITYAHTLDQTIGDILTLISIALLLLTLRRQRRHNP